MGKISNHPICVTIIIKKEIKFEPNQLLKDKILINDKNLLVGFNIPYVELKATIGHGISKKHKQIVVEEQLDFATRLKVIARDGL